MIEITRKVLLNLGVLILTFLIGCIVQFSFARSEANQTVAHPPASNNVQTPPGWRRITTGRVSFFVPPEMEPSERRGNDGVVLKPNSDNSQYLVFYYSYGSGISTDVNEISRQRKQVMVSGKPAWISKWEPSAQLPWCGLDLSWIQLVVTDVGDGNKFELYALSSDLITAQRVIDTVEIH